MPIGSYSLTPYVAHSLTRKQPRKILDLGIGFGLYGAVVREWLDLGVQPWSTYLVGIEAWGAYGNPLWDLYNIVYVETIQNYLSNNQEVFDCVLLMDVLEHFSHEDGQQIIQWAQQRLAPGGSFLIGTPGEFFAQGAVYGNEYECHRSIWRADEFADRGFSVILDGNADAFGNKMILVEWSNS